MTRRGAWHVHRSREHVLCRTGGCMRHETCNANGHGMACNGRIPTSAVSQDTMGRIPPTAQHLHARVLFVCRILFRHVTFSKHGQKRHVTFFGLFKSLGPFVYLDPFIRTRPGPKAQQARWQAPCAGRAAVGVATWKLPVWLFQESSGCWPGLHISASNANYNLTFHVKGRLHGKQDHIT